ncbi:hypothetical protein LTR33_000306 [Friedmanniomyces endolithicus]|nr:hypothetical protein LTR33_000306 [Friedmanniomyces endolithicus]
MPTLLDLGRLLTALKENASASDWRTRWLGICELLWDSLAASRAAAIPEQQLDAFIKMLRTEDKFALARNVIPELREVDISDAPNPQQQRILEASADLRGDFFRRESCTQSDFDTALYIAEKRILLDAELHRAQVLLYHSGLFGASSENEIAAWLATHPDMMAKAAADDDSEHLKREQHNKRT